MISLLRRIGGPNAFSLSLWIWLSPVAVIGTFLSALPTVDPESYPATFVFSSISYLFGGPIFFLARRYWLTRVADDRPRPLLAILVFALIGLTVSLSFSLMMSVFFQTWEGNYWQLAASRSWLGTFWSCILAISLDARARFITSKQAVQGRISELEALLEAKPQAIENIRDKALLSLRRVLLKYLKSGTSESLTDAADQVSRDVSRRILSTWDEGTTFSTKLEQRVSIIPALRESLRRPRKPAMVGAVLFIGLALQGLIWLSYVAVLNALLTAIHILIAGYLIRLLGRTSGLLTLLTLALLLGSNFALSNALMEASDVNGFSLVGVSIGAWILAGFITVQLTLDSQRRLVVKELTAVADSYDWNLNKLRQELWLESRKVARIMHGDVQARLRAAAIQFVELDPAALDQLRSDCISALNAGNDRLTLEDFLDQATNLWQGTLEISVHGLASVSAQVNSDAEATAAVIEIIREGLSNSARHAKVRELHVTLGTDENPGGTSVKLSVSHAGTLDPGFKEGLGTQIVRELSSSWSLTQKGEEVVLEASIPLLPVQWPREESNFRHTV